MTKRILVAVDLTHLNEAEKLLREANRLAEFYGSELSVITVLPDYGMSFVGSFFKEGTLKEAANAASDTLHELVRKAMPGRDGVQHIVEIGAAYEKVIEAVSTTGADLVVVGAHKPDMADKIIGPNSARIVRMSPVSTLVIRG